ncbi:regulation of nuclear pre-mRNA domain-containing protein 1B-like isoform X1 [Pistacia vera]|uniref:regulation of nuclear pre-mRNA domain-containing protein 1B-like isoform X1 n=1 Tax=Pistacia vera TaxID=55513 RepID=UPI001263E3A1|nr:regulation of nuclear pre-mRNA domain-containing protein 1B-like isoform X1 [Pistacia vera]XP_031271520.1 regulation of nuclear pre-mRNA domain-containing protein 1B-like isoform X1 [Pistacia vera]
MGSTFNPQILVEKLAKLNNSQTSIETLSHWCIFHMNKAKQVVETWDRQFHCSPREQRLAFLYLANDILQNSRRKGSEFVGEFWKVLPDALRDVMDNGDEFGRNAARRLINIWEERKVFGSRGQILKEELVGRHLESYNRNGKHQGMKLQKQPIGNTVDKIVSGYQVVYGGQIDEDVVLNKCRNAISSIEKVEKEIGSDIHSGQLHGSSLVEELQGQHATLRDCIEQLTAVESSRANLVNHLREAFQEQELKLAQIRNELQAAQSKSEHVCRQLLNCDNVPMLAEQNTKEAHTSMAPPSFMSGDREQSAPVMYTRQVSFAEKSGHVEEDTRKSAAAAVAAKLTASTSSAQMLSYVLSSLASEGVIGNSSKEHSGDFPSEKRPKIENEQSYLPPQNPQRPPVPSFPHPESLQHNITTTTQQLTTNDPPPPPPSSPPPMPPLPPLPPFQMPQYIQNTAAMTSAPYSYNMSQPPPPTMPGYPGAAAPITGMSPFAAPPTNPYQSFQGSDGNFYSQPSSVPMAPISRQ